MIPYDLPMALRSLPAVVLLLLILCASNLPGGEPPFVEYPADLKPYLATLHQRPGSLSFQGESGPELERWRRKARGRLKDLLGLKLMEQTLKEFEPRVELSPAQERTDHLRFSGTIETEPGIRIPFWLLKPKSIGSRPHPLAICSHGHDRIGRHTYAGVWRNEAHRQQGTNRGGPIGIQAVRHGFIALVPATRGLAEEIELPDLKGRHGKRPCRAQLIHALMAGRTAVGERVWDLQRLLDWGLTQPDVDPSKVLMMGNSGGGVLTVHTAAIDPRISIAVPSCSFTSFRSREGYIFHCDCCLIPRVQVELGDFSDIGGLISPRPLLAINGHTDGLHHRPAVERAVARVRRIYRAAGATSQFRHLWGAAGHQFYPDLMWPLIQQWLNHEEGRFHRDPAIPRPAYLSQRPRALDRGGK